MLISVHIPKTGGGTFGRILQRHFGDRLLMDYGDKPFTHDSETRNKAALRSRAEMKDHPRNFDCVHGHFLPTKYDIHEQENVFATWVRCPYQRVVSRYYFGLRMNDPSTANRSIHEFCEMERFHNFYDKYLWNFDIQRFCFIGITDDYEASLNVFGKQFGIRDLDINEKNVNPEKKFKRDYQIGDDLKKLIYQFNRSDFAIYEKAKRINDTLKKKYLG